MERERPLLAPFSPLVVTLTAVLPVVTVAVLSLDAGVGALVTAGAFADEGVTLETAFDGSGFLTGAFETGLAAAFLTVGAGREGDFLAT